MAAVAMRDKRLTILGALALALVGCSAPPAAPPALSPVAAEQPALPPPSRVAVQPQPAPPPPHQVAVERPAPPRAPGKPAAWKAVLIAGDDQERAFDDAVDAMAAKLHRFGVAGEDIAILKASAQGADAATGINIRQAFADLHPGPRDGCFVYITSHGAPGRGLVMRRARAFLSPTGLGFMLGGSCGNRPTVVIASGCYSGIFATQAPMPAPNRMILTAARDDRPSFGCNANLDYTFFDKCILDNLERGMDWRVVMDKTRACVSGNEWDLHVNAPSEPQLSIGATTAGLRAFTP